MSTEEKQLKPLYQILAETLAWKPPVNTTFVAQRQAELKRLTGYLPSGAGWDHGTKIDTRSHEERILLHGSFHHMNEAGFYDGWTDHTIIVTASLRTAFTLKIAGRDRNDIKDHLYELFDVSLRQLVPRWGKACNSLTRLA